MNKPTRCRVFLLIVFCLFQKTASSFAEEAAEEPKIPASSWQVLQSILVSAIEQEKAEREKQFPLFNASFEKASQKYTQEAQKINNIQAGSGLYKKPREWAKTVPLGIEAYRTRLIEEMATSKNLDAVKTTIEKRKGEMFLSEYREIIEQITSFGKNASFGKDKEIEIKTHKSQIDKKLSRVSADKVKSMLDLCGSRGEACLNKRFSKWKEDLSKEGSSLAESIDSQNIDRQVEHDIGWLITALIKRKEQIAELQDNDGYEQAIRDEVAKQFMETAEWLKFKEQGGDKVIELINQGNYTEAATLAAKLETDIVIFSVSNAVPAGKSLEGFKSAYKVAKKGSKGSLGTTEKLIENGFVSAKKEITEKITTLRKNHEMEKRIIKRIDNGTELAKTQKDYATKRIKEELIVNTAEGAVDTAKEKIIEQTNESVVQQVKSTPPK